MRGLSDRGIGGSPLSTAISVSNVLSAWNGRLAGEQFVEDRAQAVDVGGRGDFRPAARRLFGGHVARRAGDHAGGRHVGAVGKHLRQPEIGHVGLAVGVQQDVRGLQVAVDDPLLVQMFDRAGHGGHQPHGGMHVDRALLDPLGEALALRCTPSRRSLGR